MLIYSNIFWIFVLFWFCLSWNQDNSASSVHLTNSRNLLQVALAGGEICQFIITLSICDITRLRVVCSWFAFSGPTCVLWVSDVYFSWAFCHFPELPEWILLLPPSSITTNASCMSPNSLLTLEANPSTMTLSTWREASPSLSFFLYWNKTKRSIVRKYRSQRQKLSFSSERSQ